MNDKKKDLEGQIQDKQHALQRHQDMMASYAKAIGRDRWYNRAHHDLTTLLQELQVLRSQRSPPS